MVDRDDVGTGARGTLTPARVCLRMRIERGDRLSRASGPTLRQLRLQSRRSVFDAGHRCPDVGRLLGNARITRQFAERGPQASERLPERLDLRASDVTCRGRERGDRRIDAVDRGREAGSADGRELKSLEIR